MTLHSIKEFEKKKIPPSDICIIGSGIAGLELLHSLKNSSLKVTMLEGGGKEFDWKTQTLHRYLQCGHPIRTIDYRQSYGLKEAKKTQAHIRQFGGNLNVWGGRWKTCDHEDFLPNSLYSMSPWPISIDDLLPYYEGIAKDYEIGEMFELQKEIDHPRSYAFLGRDCFQGRINYKQIPLYDHDHQMIQEAVTSPNCKVVLGANATHLSLSEDLSHINEVTVSTLDQKKWRVRAKVFILACGTIENTRLLLASNDRMEKGIGNQYGLVGKNLIDHPKFQKGQLIPNPRSPVIKEALYSKTGVRKSYIELTISPKYRQQWQLPNHCWRILDPFFKEVPKKANQFKYPLRFYLEQLPNRESCIFLSDEIDELGVPLPCLDWRISDEDKTCFKKFIHHLSELVEKNGIGTLHFNDMDEDLSFLKDASHQMGTTRMAKDPQDGVVDENCKVFGVDNLYIAGNSVFPVGGNANPAFTIVVLARRLAKMLASRVSL